MGNTWDLLKSSIDLRSGEKLISIDSGVALFVCSSGAIVGASNFSPLLTWGCGGEGL